MTQYVLYLVVVRKSDPKPADLLATQPQAFA